MNPYLELIRPFQWLKNLVVFVPLFLSGLMFYPGFWFDCVVSFVMLCAASSFGYVLNDLANKNEDYRHFDKRKRPLASGRAVEGVAVLLAVYLMMWMLTIAMSMTATVILILIGIDFLYNMGLRNVKYLDIATISVKYPLRAALGYMAIRSTPNIWVLISLFLFAFILACMKRKGDPRYWMSDKPFYVALIGLAITLPFIRATLASIFMSAALCWYYERINYERSKSLAILRDKWFMLTASIYAVAMFLSIYWGWLI